MSSCQGRQHSNGQGLHEKRGHHCQGGNTRTATVCMNRGVTIANEDSAKGFCVGAEARFEAGEFSEGFIFCRRLPAIVLCKGDLALVEFRFSRNPTGLEPLRTCPNIEAF